MVHRRSIPRRYGRWEWRVGCSLRYIVGMDGHAEPGSVQSLQSSNVAFEAPAIEAVVHANFRPARLKGRVVRQLVEQIVRFAVQR